MNGKPGFLPKPPPLREIAFLHIGKNAGTQIMHLAEQLRPHGLHIRELSHDRRLFEVPNQIDYFFSIRNPITRFKSGFYSRKRKGLPRILAEWTRSEAKAFGTFEHANDLAEALFRPDERGLLAAQAIQAIRHTAMQQIDWFSRIGFLSLRPPLWIIRQEKFEPDFNRFLARLGLAITCADLRPATDPAAAHRNDYSGTTELTELARENLRRWYARDFVFYDVCEQWMKDNDRAA